MVYQVDYATFKKIVQDWDVPYVYWSDDPNQTLPASRRTTRVLTIKIFPGFETFLNEDGSDYTDFTSNLKSISDDIVPFTGLERRVQDVDETNSTVKYYGYEDRDGNWMIIKEDTSVTNVATYRFAKSTVFTKGQYTTNWTNRTSITYGLWSA